MTTAVTYVFDVLHVIGVFDVSETPGDDSFGFVNAITDHSDVCALRPRSACGRAGQRPTLPGRHGVKHQLLSAIWHNCGRCDPDLYAVAGLGAADSAAADAVGAVPAVADRHAGCLA